MPGLFDMLGFKGLETIEGNVQSVDNMSVIPICAKDDLTDEIAKPDEVRFVRTTNYGTMNFENENKDFEGLIPSNMMVVDEKQAAQDHAMAGPGVIEPGAQKSYDNACCVQSSQGGLLRRSEQADDAYNVLPHEIRVALLNPGLRNRREAGKIWKIIESFNRGAGCGNRGHLEDFFVKYRKELNDFASEFEAIPGQVGGMVFFNGIPVGIEIMPSEIHWLRYWRWLIRGCYGAQMLKAINEKKLSRATLDIPKLPDDIDSIMKAGEEFLKSVQGKFIEAIQGINIKQVTEPRKISRVNPFFTRMLYTGRGGGDIIIHNKRPVYLSAVV